MNFLPANTSFAILLFLAGCAMLVSILLRRSYRYFGKRSGPRVIQGLERVPRPGAAWDGSYHDAEARIGRQEVEMAEMFRDMNGQLTSKMHVLEQLISDSQKQIDRMEELLADGKAQHPAAAEEEQLS